MLSRPCDNHIKGLEDVAAQAGRRIRRSQTQSRRMDELYVILSVSACLLDPFVVLKQR